LSSGDLGAPVMMRLAFRPGIDLISSTRRYVADLLDHVLVDPDATSRVAMTIHELLENVFKYSVDGCASVDIAVGDRAEQKVVRIRATNRATEDRLLELTQRLDELRGAEDPVQLYYRIIAQSAKRKEGSGLGLARIRAEGEMDLSYVVDGDLITIVAETPVEVAEQS
jgi:two-component sensor histidine kinase